MLTSLLFLESNYNMRAWLAKGIKSDALDQKLYVTDRGKNKGRGSAFPSAASPHHTASISSSGCAAERERADFTVAQAWDAPLRLLSSFRRAFCRASRRVPPPPKLCSPRTLSPQGEEGIWDSREGVEAEGEEKDEGKKMQEGLEIMKGRGRWRDRQMEGRGKQKASRQTLGDGGRGGERENDCLRLISPHMSPSVQRPGWDGTAALSEMTERAKDTRARQEAECNPMNPGFAYYAAERPFKMAFFSPWWCLFDLLFFPIVT